MSNDKYCQRCGIEVVIVPSVEPTKIFCTKCGHRFLEGALFCAQCGDKSIRENTQEETVQIPIVVQQPVSQSLQQYVPTPQSIATTLNDSKQGYVGGIFLLIACCLIITAENINELLRFFVLSEYQYWSFPGIEYNFISLIISIIGCVITILLLKKGRIDLTKTPVQILWTPLVFFTFRYFLLFSGYLLMDIHGTYHGILLYFIKLIYMQVIVWILVIAHLLVYLNICKKINKLFTIVGIIIFVLSLTLIIPETIGGRLYLQNIIFDFCSRIAESMLMLMFVILLTVNKLNAKSIVIFLSGRIITEILMLRILVQDSSFMLTYISISDIASCIVGASILLISYFMNRKHSLIYIN